MRRTGSVLLSLFFLLAVASSAAGGSAPARVTAISVVEASAEGTVLEITTTIPVEEAEAFTLSDPPRVVLEIPQALLRVRSPSPPPPGALLRAVQTSQLHRGRVWTTHVILELTSAASYRLERSASGIMVTLGSQVAGGKGEDEGHRLSPLPDGREEKRADASSSPLSFTLWPLLERRDDPVEESRHWGLLGPLLSQDTGEENEEYDVALRPLFHLRGEEARDLLRWEFLYPLLTYERVEGDSEFQFIQLLNFRSEGEIPAEREKRFDLFPFFLSGRTERGERYGALFPLGGVVHDRFGQDEIRFVLFPAYFRLLKKGVTTEHYLWPFFSRVSGEGASGFRVWPFYGREVREGVSDTQFVLWPFFFRARLAQDTENPQEITALLPFYVRERSPERDATRVLWPFAGHVVDRAEKFEEWDILWPLIFVAKGENRNIVRILPFYAEERRRTIQTFLLKEIRTHDKTILFPLYIHEEAEFPDSRWSRTRLVYYLYSDITEENLKDGGTTRRLDAWPLFTYTRDREGQVRFGSLALLEAILPDNEKVEESYAPLWRLVSYRADARGRYVTSLFWDLFRWERGAASRGWDVLGPVLTFRERGEEERRLSLLGGLIEYRVRNRERSLGFLYLPWGIPLGRTGDDGAEGTADASAAR